MSSEPLGHLKESLLDHNEDFTQVHIEEQPQHDNNEALQSLSLSNRVGERKSSVFNAPPLITPRTLAKSQNRLSPQIMFGDDEAPASYYELSSIKLENDDNDDDNDRYCVVSRMFLPNTYFQKNYRVTMSNLDMFQKVLANTDDIETFLWQKSTRQFENYEEDAPKAKCHVCDLVFESIESRYDTLGKKARRRDRRIDHSYYQSRYRNGASSDDNDKFKVEEISCKQFSKNCLYVFLIIISIFVFLLVASVPMWLIEGSNEVEIMNDIVSKLNETSGNETIVYDLFNIESWHYTNCLYFSTVTCRYFT